LSIEKIDVNLLVFLLFFELVLVGKTAFLLV
jgi:hypothetical protein